MAIGSSKVTMVPQVSIKEFTEINRFWDKSRGSVVAKILPGEFYVTFDKELISTVLGSCVSACIRDRVNGIGGMNHFMLPFVTHEEPSQSYKTTEAARYGNYAMEHLINTILKYGGRRENLEVKVFGGGKVIANMGNVGARNVDFVREYLNTEGMQVAAEDVGDKFPRKVIYAPYSGKVMVKKMRTLHNDTIKQREQRYLDTFVSEPVSGSVELFD